MTKGSKINLVLAFLNKYCLGYQPRVAPFSISLHYKLKKPQYSQLNSDNHTNIQHKDKNDLIRSSAVQLWHLTSQPTGKQEASFTLYLQKNE